MTVEHHLGTLTGALADVMRWITEERIPGVVIGGVACSILGRPRMTRDVDALILGDEIGWERIIESVDRYGLELRSADAVDFLRRTRVLLLRHTESTVDVDVSFGGLPFEREAVEHASTVRVGPISARVPLVEDLVIMKALARRPRDWSDIEGLFDVHPHMDLTRIRHWLREFGSVLEMPEIQEDFEEMLRKRRR
jgi:hypothetical protein